MHLAHKSTKYEHDFSPKPRILLHANMKPFLSFYLCTLHSFLVNYLAQFFTFPFKLVPISFIQREEAYKTWFVWRSGKTLWSVVWWTYVPILNGKGIKLGGMVFFHLSHVLKAESFVNYSGKSASKILSKWKYKHNFWSIISLETPVFMFSLLRLFDELLTKTFGKIEMANAIFWIYLGGMA